MASTDPENPFAPPRAAMTGAEAASAETEAGEPVPASVAHRLLACILGLALGFAFMVSSSIAGEMIATTVGIAATLSPWEPMDYAAGAVFLAFYAPFAFRRIGRRQQTLPFRIFGLRFTKAGGSPAETWRIVLLHGLPTVLIFWIPVLAAGYLRLGGPLEGLLRFGGLVLLCANALSSGRASGQTWLDEVAGLRVSKA